MPRINIELSQLEFGFSATDEGGVVVKMDSSKSGGGQGFGISPMQNLLASLGGCSGIDIVSILRKQRQNFTSIRMEIDGDREQGKEPALWQKVHIDLYISGEVEVAKANHAVGLSIDKYCSVAETLRRAGCEITWELFLED